MIPDWLSFRAKNRLVGALQESSVPTSNAARAVYTYLSDYFPPSIVAQRLDRVVGFYLLLRALRREQVPGAVVECGVGRGYSLFVIGYFMQRLGYETKLYGFDSFQGFPEPNVKDASFRNPKRGDLWQQTSADFVREHFLDGALDRVRLLISLVPGFFEDTVTRADIGDIALLHLDVDLYDSYRTCLRSLGPRVRGAIVYDEYRSPKWPGATLAIDECLPEIGHRLYYSETLQRHLSLRVAPENDALNARVVAELDCRPALEN